MTDTKPCPLAVLDASDHAQETTALDHRLTWLRSQGINPNETRRVEVYEDGDGPYALVTGFLRNADGNRYCEVDHDHSKDWGGCRTAVTTRRVPVTALPPVEADPGEGS